MNKKVVICRYTISETNAIFMNLTHAIAKEIPDKKYLEVYPENSNISDNIYHLNFFFFTYTRQRPVLFFSFSFESF